MDIQFLAGINQCIFFVFLSNVADFFPVQASALKIMNEEGRNDIVKRGKNKKERKGEKTRDKHKRKNMSRRRRKIVKDRIGIGR